MHIAPVASLLKCDFCTVEQQLTTYQLTEHVQQSLCIAFETFYFLINTTFSMQIDSCVIAQIYWYWRTDVKDAASLLSQVRWCIKKGS